MDYSLSRRHSEIPGNASNQLEPPDAGKHEVVVRRMSEQLPHAGKRYDERFKSLSETEMLKVRRKCSAIGGFSSTPGNISARSKSMDALPLDSSSPPPKKLPFKKYSWSPTKLVPDSSPLQLIRSVAAKRKLGAPSQYVTGGVADDKTPGCTLNFLQPGGGGGGANSKSAPEICSTFQLKGGVKESSAPDVYKGVASMGHSTSYQLQPLASAQMKRAVAFPKKFSAPNVGDAPLCLATFQIDEDEEDESSSSGRSTPVDRGSLVDNSRQPVVGASGNISGQSMPVNRATPVDREQLDSEQPDSHEQSSCNSKQSSCNSHGIHLTLVGYDDSLQPVATTGHKGTGASSKTAPVKSSEKLRSQPFNPLPPGDLKRGMRLSGPPRRINIPSDYKSEQHQTPPFMRVSDVMGKSTSIKNQGSNEQLNRQPDTSVSWPSALGERGQLVGMLALLFVGINNRTGGIGNV